jgi:uncharacterized metal-binding protein YceD (DUF177 family)
MGAYGINIVGLSNSVHHFDYDFGDEFFRQYGTLLIEKGSFHADVELNKHETFIEVDFKIKGTATLICDRSLEPFEYPIKNSHKVVFKYGDQDEELTDEIVMIHRDTVTLELGQYLYEFIALDVPLKKLHPRFKNEDESDDEASEGKIVYSSGGDDSTEDDSGDENIDPRWNILKKLK